MGKTVEMPLWALLLLVAFAAVTFASHFLFPSVRWFFRRRMERVVARLNERLERPIEPFKLARRHDMIQRLIYDPSVARAVAAYAKKHGVPENVAFEKARRYAREIVPRFSATAYFGVAIRLGKRISRSLYHVRPGLLDQSHLREVDKDATVIFVINHRSNMDYVLVTWLAANRSALSYAVGEWARVWPLSSLIRSLGGYFIRRQARGVLYRRVLERYVQLSTQGGVTQAFFPEGGLSLTGGLAAPKLGLLKYIYEDSSPDARDVAFVPVALNYDRVFEDRILVSAAQQRGRRFQARISVVTGFVLRQVWRRLTGRDHRHGYAAVSFGAPLTLSRFRHENPGAPVELLGARLMQRIAEEVPVLPAPLVARALLMADTPLTEDALRQAVADMINALPHAHLHLPNGGKTETAEAGLRMMRMRGFVRDGADGVEIVEQERPLLAYYAASIAHLFRDRSA